MSNLLRLAGFPVLDYYAFRLDGRRRRIGVSGVQAICLAVEILSLSDAGRSLYPLRAKIRAVQASDCRAALALLVKTTKHRRLRTIAIWLRGRCGGYVGTSIVAALAGDRDPRTRLAVAKALQRLSGWAVLEAMAAGDPSQRVRYVAAQRVRRDFRSRLEGFAEHVSPLPVSSEQTPTYWSATCDLRSPVGTKSDELIRLLLQRIRHLIRGGKHLSSSKES